MRFYENSLKPYLASPLRIHTIAVVFLPLLPLLPQPPLPTVTCALIDMATAIGDSIG